MNEVAQIYLTELKDNILPFWLNHSIDKESGGYFTCLDRGGQVYDTDKFVWLQCRQIWTFSMLYNRLEANPRYLEVAKHGIDFIDKYAHDSDLNFYFSLDRKGSPLIEPYNIFSDCFACMAYAQYGLASQDEKYLEKAKEVYYNILRRSSNPKGKWNKSSGHRPLINFALPMILSNLVIELKEVLSKEEVDKKVEECINIVMNVFRDDKTHLIYENRTAEGKFSDTYEGRLMNPGHGIEAMWFMLDIGKQRNAESLIHDSIDSLIALLEYGWDKRFKGIFYFKDILNHPPQQLEHDQKLWWVHLEALVALSKALNQSYRNKELQIWYDKVYQYTWSKFRDSNAGEWFGYLNREGTPHLTLKGGKWKGCFHVPRALFQCFSEWKSR